MHFQHKKCHLCGFKSCVCIKIIKFCDNLRQPRQRKLDKEEFSSFSSLFNDPLSNCSQGSVTLPGKRKQVYTAWIGTHPNSLSPITRQTIRQQMHRFLCPTHFPSPGNSQQRGLKLPLLLLYLFRTQAAGRASKRTPPGGVTQVQIASMGNCSSQEISK